MVLSIIVGIILGLMFIQYLVLILYLFFIDENADGLEEDFNIDSKLKLFLSFIPFVFYCYWFKYFQWLEPFKICIRNIKRLK